VERPQRPWAIWYCDVGKQLTGGFFIHFANILVSSLLGKSGDECAWYFINYLFDCTIGVGIVYLIHEAICSAARQLYPDGALARIGEYDGPKGNPDLVVWAKQMSAYLASLLVNKAIVGGGLLLLKDPMGKLGDWLFRPLQPHPQEELIVVMVLCPWLLMTVQFLLFDAILKATPKRGDNGTGGGALADGDVLSPYASLGDSLGLAFSGALATSSDKSDEYIR